MAKFVGRLVFFATAKSGVLKVQALNKLNVKNACEEKFFTTLDNFKSEQTDRKRKS